MKCSPLSHPNFTFPLSPKFTSGSVGDVEAATEFTIEAIARAISPPKVDGEDEEFACEDVAAMIRGELGEEIRSRIQAAYQESR